MKFKIVAIIVCCATLLFSLANLTYAMTADPTVIYDGRKQSLTVTNAAENDLFSAFKGVMPGDKKTQKIVLQGTNIDSPAYLYLRSESADNISLPEAITLSVYSGDTLVSSSAVAGNGSLSEGILLYAFEKQETVQLTVVLDVPVSVGNEIQGIEKQINWIFTATQTGHEISPETGDDTRILLYLVLFVMSGSTLLWLSLHKRRTEEPEHTSHPK